MRITDLIDKRSINLNAKPKSKTEALEMAIGLMERSGKLRNTEEYRRVVFKREEEGSTGIGEGIAIPHGKSDAVTKPGLAAMVVRNGVDFEALDNEPVSLIFLIAAPNTKDNIHLDVLSKLSVLMMDEEFSNELRNAESAEEFIAAIDKADSGKEGILSSNDKASGEKAKILAVTSCPTGIAHTYMAAEGLMKAASARSISIKVETRGSSGAKNVLTAEEIAEADCIIVAADAKVPMDRFNGKKVIECQVSDGINKAERLIERALSGSAPIYTARGGAGAESAESSSNSVGHKIYTQLMNGVSHMLPFVVGGGILIAIAFLIDGLAVDMNSISEELRADFGSITPAAALFKGIGGAAFSFMLPILSGYIASAIADRPGLAAGFVGGYLAANGSSGFLGAIAAGFIAGYVVIFLRKIFDKLPESIERISPVLLYPLFGVLLTGIIMNYIIEPPVGWLNTALNTGLRGMGSASRILLGIIVGGMMAIDMGGPFNKAAYIFGTAAIAEGNYDIMAAVMIGGMVPPFAIALSTLLFKNKFTDEERKSGPTNFIMGLAFITEGAIPFAASDPIRVIPACILGSAAAGGLSMAFNCTLMAPHGGIFVVPVMGNPGMYLLALAVGAVIAAVTLGLWKRSVRSDL